MMLFIVIGYCEHDDGPFLIGPACRTQEEADQLAIESQKEHGETLGHVLQDVSIHGKVGTRKLECFGCNDYWTTDSIEEAPPCTS